MARTKPSARKSVNRPRPFPPLASRRGPLFPEGPLSSVELSALPALLRSLKNDLSCLHVPAPCVEAQPEQDGLALSVLVRLGLQVLEMPAVLSALQDAASIDDEELTAADNEAAAEDADGAAAAAASSSSPAAAAGLLSYPAPSAEPSRRLPAFRIAPPTELKQAELRKLMMALTEAGTAHYRAVSDPNPPQPRPLLDLAELNSPGQELGSHVPDPPIAESDLPSYITALQTYTAVHGPPVGHMRRVFRAAEHLVAQHHREELAKWQEAADEEDEEEEEEGQPAAPFPVPFTFDAIDNAIDLTQNDDAPAERAAGKRRRIN